jgi:predicted house-cleaning noncanonical NTP pyrophosphatase (MazG superfamily)
MNIYLNDNLIKDIEITAKEEILELIDSKLEREIVDTIYLDEVDVSLAYFKENELDLERLSEIKFETKTVPVLIEETLTQAEDYLPKLKDALNNSAAKFKAEQVEEAANLLDKTLEGIEWYLEVINGIISLIDKQELKDKGNKILKDFTQALNRAMVALQNEDFDYLADLLEVEMVEYLDKLSDFNQELLEEN